MTVGGAALGPVAASAAATWTTPSTVRICAYATGQPTLSDFVGAARWANVSGVVHLQFVFRCTGTPTNTADMWAMDLGVGVGGVNDPPAADIFSPTVDGEVSPVNVLAGSAVAHRDYPLDYYKRGSHAALLAGFEPEATPRYILFAHDRWLPPETYSDPVDPGDPHGLVSFATENKNPPDDYTGYKGAAYFRKDDPFPWVDRTVLKGYLQYPAT